MQKLILLLVLLFIIGIPMKCVSQKDYSLLDSTVLSELNSRISSKGKNPVYNYQLYFNYKDSFVYNGAVGKNKKKDTIRPINFKFKSASISKTFIAVLILQLEEEGKVDINKSISEYLDSSLIQELCIINKEDRSAEITVKQLLNHTAGLADYILDDKRYLIATKIHPKKAVTPTDHVKKYKQHGLNKKCYSPGSYYYSDTHYLLLAMLIENVTNKSLQDVLFERITSPLSLKNTYVDNWDSSYNKMMHQYLHKRDITKKLHPSFEFGGGGFITTTEDLSLFIKALFANQLFSSDTTLSKMISSDSNLYGFGIMILKIPVNWITKGGSDTLTAYGHQGFYGIEMYHIPEENITWVISKGQAYVNKNVEEFPIWLTLLRLCYRKFEN